MSILFKIITATILQLFIATPLLASFDEVTEGARSCDWGVPFLNQPSTKMERKGFRSEKFVENIYNIMTLGLGVDESEKEYFTVEFSYKDKKGHQVSLSNCALIHNKLEKSFYVYDCEDGSGKQKFYEFNCVYNDGKGHGANVSNTTIQKETPDSSTSVKKRSSKVSGQ